MLMIHSSKVTGISVAYNAMLKAVLAIAILSILGACVGVPKEIIAIDDLSSSAQNVPKANNKRIFIATTRAASSNPAIMFTGNRGRLSFAQVDVSIPPSHKSGKIERTGLLSPDPQKYFSALNPKTLPDKKALITALNTGLAKLTPENRGALVFIHGYNTSFDEALFRFAQFINDSNYNGIAILFTWPSSGRTKDYLYDFNSALGSRDELLATLKTVGQANINSGDILAHSMGAILTMETLRQAAIEGSLKTGRSTKLRNVVLASPDIDINLFAKQIKLIPVGSYEFYTLVSRDDKALKISRFLSGGISRVGSTSVNALKNLGVTIVDLTNVSSSGSSHSKFAGSPEVVKALGRALNISGLPENSSNVPSNVKVTRRSIKSNE